MHPSLADRSPRQVCLRPEYARLYPDIPAGSWLPAREVAELLVRRGQAARREQVYLRTLDPTHFEFRGGTPHGRSARTRRFEMAKSAGEEHQDSPGLVR